MKVRYWVLGIRCSLIFTGSAIAGAGSNAGLPTDSMQEAKQNIQNDQNQQQDKTLDTNATNTTEKVPAGDEQKNQ